MELIVNHSVSHRYSTNAIIKKNFLYTHDHMFHLSCKYISFYLSHVVCINVFTMCVYGNMTSECQYMFISVSNAMQSQDIMAILWIQVLPAVALYIAALM